MCGRYRLRRDWEQDLQRSSHLVIENVDVEELQAGSDEAFPRNRMPNVRLDDDGQLIPELRQRGFIVMIDCKTRDADGKPKLATCSLQGPASAGSALSYSIANGRFQGDLRCRSFTEPISIALDGKHFRLKQSSTISHRGFRGDDSFSMTCNSRKGVRASASARSRSRSRTAASSDDPTSAARSRVATFCQLHTSVCRDRMEQQKGRPYPRGSEVEIQEKP